MALKGLNRAQTQDLIIHSDGGGQYYAKAFTALTRKAGMRNSMCTSVYEKRSRRAYQRDDQEQLSETLDPQDFKSLQIQTKRAVNLYNNERPHKALGGLSLEHLSRPY